MISGADINLAPRDGQERKFQFEVLDDGSVIVTLLVRSLVTGGWIEIEYIRAAAGDPS